MKDKIKCYNTNLYGKENPCLDELSANSSIIHKSNIFPLKTKAKINDNTVTSKLQYIRSSFI